MVALEWMEGPQRLQLLPVEVAAPLAEALGLRPEVPGCLEPPLWSLAAQEGLCWAPHSEGAAECWAVAQEPSPWEPPLGLQEGAP